MVGTVFIYFIVDWATFRLVPEDEREAMINEFKTFINDKASAREQQRQKVDILLWYLRPEMKELNEIENELNKLRIAISLFKHTHTYQ